jgi:AcrR family transcriptional regulator
VGRALELTADGGFDAVSLGRLANELSMSKAGVIGHFGTMESLHLAAVQRAVEVFGREVWQPAQNRAPGLERLLKLCDSWIGYLSGDHYVGGCFTSGEFHESPAVRSAVAEAMRTWQAVLRQDIQTAQAAGEVPAKPEAGDVALTLSGIAAATGQSLRLELDDAAPRRARRAMRHALGVARAPRGG